MDDRPRYTTIIHKVRIDLDLSCNEYCVADIIYHLSNNPSAKVSGWCYASKEKIAEYMGLSKKVIHDIIGRLVASGLVEKDEDTKWLKTTSAWYDAIVVERLKYSSNESTLIDTKGVSSRNEKLLRQTRKVSSDRHETFHNIYIDNNKDINKDNTHVINNGLEKLKTSYPDAYKRISKSIKQEVL